MNAPGLLSEWSKRAFEILDKALAGEIPDRAAALRPVLRDLVEEDDTDTFREVWMLANASLAREYGAVIPHTEGLASTAASAEGFLETAVKIAGKTAARQAIASRAQAYRETGRYDEALTDLTRAIDLDPANPWAIGERGETYRLMRRYDEALTDFTRAIDLAPAYAWAIASRGQAYLETGRYEEALADFTRGSSWNPAWHGRSPGVAGSTG